MRWNSGRRSDNLEDRRAEGGGRMRAGAGIGLGGIAIIVVVGLLTGQNPLTLLTQILGSGASEVVAGPPPSAEDLAAEETEVQFVSAVLDSAQVTWHRLLPAGGATYTDAKLVLFRDAIESACGLGQSAMGPFYCPGDQKVYIDLGFYEDLKRRFGAPGDFAQAYVIAHEIGHHVQNLLGIERQVREAQRRNPGQQNALSVALELQADCLAGIWANAAESGGYLEPGDAEEALNAAASIGDDRIQKSAGARVSPESFTHGSSEQRVSWFRRGLERGDLNACDTFSK
jgi:predicted metalloprotease